MSCDYDRWNAGKLIKAFLKRYPDQGPLFAELRKEGRRPLLSDIRDVFEDAVPVRLMSLDRHDNAGVNNFEYLGDLDRSSLTQAFDQTRQMYGKDRRPLALFARVWDQSERKVAHVVLHTLGVIRETRCVRCPPWAYIDPRTEQLVQIDRRERFIDLIVQIGGWAEDLPDDLIMPPIDWNDPYDVRQECGPEYNSSFMDTIRMNLLASGLVVSRNKLTKDLSDEKLVEFHLRRWLKARKEGKLLVE